MNNILLLNFDAHRELKSWAENVSLEMGERPVPCLCIARKQKRSIKPAAYIIPLDNLFKFAPEDENGNRNDIQAIQDAFNTCLNIAQILDCPTDSKSINNIGKYIQDNFYKVINLKPHMEKGKAIADVKGKFNGKEFTSEVTAH